MRRLLVVDDDPDVRTLLALALLDTGWTVTTASGGAAALAACAAGEVDALLLDVEMPGTSGRDVLAALAGRTPAVAISAGACPSLADELAALGALALVGKPFNPLGLPAVLGSALGWLTTTTAPPTARPPAG